jgi:ABC-type uncharacterized transport system involved in gliding motility auxiliary subunit
MIAINNKIPPMNSAVDSPTQTQAKMNIKTKIQLVKVISDIIVPLMIAVFTVVMTLFKN